MQTTNTSFVWKQCWGLATLLSGASFRNILDTEAWDNHVVVEQIINIYLNLAGSR